MKRKMLITITLICIMLLNCILPIAQVRAATSTTDVEITLNGNLYNAVKSNLQRQGITAVYNDAQRTLTISQEALDSVTTLNLSNFAINDIAGIEVFKNVTSIDLSANKLTEESNLEVLNNFTLDFLDLSSNEIADVSKITDIDIISKVNLHNQKFSKVEIIEVDESNDSDQLAKVTFKLPQILSKAAEDGIINPDWLPEYKEDDGPYVNWRVFNGVEVEIVTANKTQDTFSPYYGMTTLKIKVTDPKNPLYNSDITLYYITVRSEERGIVFKDVNLYKAVKEQLTKNQEINEDLVETEEGNLYSKAYDEPMVLVIKIDDIINNIPSLKLTDKKIVDLTGIEKFVGLEKELDVSSNYIEDISKIIELKEEKEAEEKKLQERFLAQQQLIKEIRDKMEEQRKIINECEDKLEELNKAIDELVAKYAEENAKENASESTLTSISKQIEEKNKQVEEYTLKKAEAENKFESYKQTLKDRMDKIYHIFEKQYKVTNILTAELARQTSVEFLNMTKEDAATKLNNQYTKIQNIESYLTGYERNYLINYFEIPTETKATVDKKDEQGNVTQEEVTKAIEEPIKTYFEDLKDKTKDKSLGDLKTKITEMKRIAEIFKMANYCFVERLYNNTTECLAREYLQKEIELKQLDGEDYSVLQYVKSNLTNILKDLKTAGNTCEGQVSYTNNFEDMYALAGRIVSASGDEITDNVTIPQLKYLDISVNLIESLEGIDKLVELKGLYAGDNEICDITNISWSSMTKLLELDLSFNDISNIKPLEVIASLEKLSVAKNLLEGAFDFNFSEMPNLVYFDLSQNRIDDIAYLRNQLIYAAKAENKDISEYLKTSGLDIKLYGQILTMNVELTNESTLTYVDLPNIFRQAEEFDYDRTSFAVNSILGNVTNDGKQVILDTSRLGTQSASVSITTGTYNGPASRYGIAYGTSCTIYYTVVDKDAIVEPEDPVNNTVNNIVANNNTVDNNTTNNTVNNVVNNTIDNNTVDNNVTNNTVDNDPVIVPIIELGYKTEDEYILGVSPNTSLKDFKEKLTDDYKVEVKSNGKVVESGNIATAMMVVLYDENNEPVAVYEIVVKGDVNGDGTADAVDSGLIKAHRAAVTMLSGAYEKAGDVNSDGSIDAIDARLLLYHRAEVPGYIL